MYKEQKCKRCGDSFKTKAGEKDEKRVYCKPCWKDSNFKPRKINEPWGDRQAWKGMSSKQRRTNLSHKY